MKKKEIKRVNELPNFPYSSFEEFQNAVNEGDVEIGVTMDIARRWLTGNGKYVPKWQQIKAYAYMFIPYFFAIFLLLYSILNLKLHYLLLLIPFLISMFTLTPMGLRAFGIMNLWVLAGILLLLYSLFGKGSEGILLLSLTVVVPWLSHRFLYKLASRVANRTIVEHEDLFIGFTQAKAVTLRYPATGIQIWFDEDWDKLKRQQGKMKDSK